jgi:hypothetical protein
MADNNAVISSSLGPVTEYYDDDYFSGAQSSIYIGDVWVDDVSSFQFEVTHVKTPIFGYASTYWDALSRGPVIVRGSFTINFKEAGYLWLVLDRYRRLKGLGSTNPFVPGGEGVNGKEAEKAIAANIEQTYQLDKFASTPNSSMSSDAMAQLISRFNSPGDFASPGQGTVTTSIDANGKKTSSLGIDPFENACEAFENAIWQDNNIGGAGNENGNNSDITSRRADDSRLDGFDIFITYGNYMDGNDLNNHTVRKICNVAILGQSQILNPDGKPIQEAYSFIARNFV